QRLGLPATFLNTLEYQAAVNGGLWWSKAKLYHTPLAFDDGISRLVAQQYEEHPYPIWTWVNLPAEGSALDQLRRLQAAARLPPAPDAPRVLIAGCGTGQQAIQVAAALGQDAEVLAVDLSATSLDHAADRAVEHCVSIEFRQADILTLDALDEQFD